MLNTTLLNTAGKIMTSTAPGYFYITAQFINSKEGSTFSFYLPDIDTIVYNRDYAGKFSDEIDLTAKISPKDYALLQDQGQNLRCIVNVTYADKFGKIVYDPKPIQTQYCVIINDPEDIRFAAPDLHRYTEPSKTLSVRLIEETVYNLRQKKINVVLQTLNVEQAIYAITQMLGIEKIHLVPPDNTHVYDHIPIGSYQGISSVYGYLQSTCGVYAKGINYYVTGGVLYVYPPFDTDIQYDRSVLFYQVDTGRYEGCDVFHALEKDSVSIVINSQPSSVDLSIAGAENVGTGFIFNRASRLTDGITAIDGKNGATFTEQPSLSINLANARTMDENRSNMVHIHGTDNPFPKMSEIIAHQASLVTVMWPKADPFRLDPCQKVTYYYDRNEVMIKKTGIMERAEYHMIRGQRIHTKSLFSCAAQLVLRLSPNESTTL